MYDIADRRVGPDEPMARPRSRSSDEWFHREEEVLRDGGVVEIVAQVAYELDAGGATTAGTGSSSPTTARTRCVLPPLAFRAGFTDPGTRQVVAAALE